MVKLLLASYSIQHYLASYISLNLKLSVSDAYLNECISQWLQTEPDVDVLGKCVINTTIP